MAPSTAKACCTNNAKSVNKNWCDLFCKHIFKDKHIKQAVEHVLLSFKNKRAHLLSRAPAKSAQKHASTFCQGPFVKASLLSRALDSGLW